MTKEVDRHSVYVVATAYAAGWRSLDEALAATRSHFSGRPVAAVGERYGPLILMVEAFLRFIDPNGEERLSNRDAIAKLRQNEESVPKLVDALESVCDLIQPIGW